MLLTRETSASTGAVRSLTLLSVLALLLAAAPALGFSPTEPDTTLEPRLEAEQVQTYSPYVMAYDKLDVEDRQGYRTEYIFGMTKGIMKSTLVPALKPVLLLFTVPLDLAFLPFAAVAGFF